MLVGSYAVVELKHGADEVFCYQARSLKKKDVSSYGRRTWHLLSFIFVHLTNDSFDFCLRLCQSIKSEHLRAQKSNVLIYSRKSGTV